MRGKRATTEQIIAVLKEAEAGAKPKDLCRMHGISRSLYGSRSRRPTCAPLRERIGPVERHPLPKPVAPNVSWSMDFISDGLSDGRRFRCLAIVDDFSRECLAIEVGTSLPGKRVAAVLDRLAADGGLPESITVDHGPEFDGWVLDEWAYRNHVRPGKPNENAYIESWNGKFRDECLNDHWFTSLQHARQVIAAWRMEYNTERTHSSLGDITPAEFVAAYRQQVAETVSLTADSKSGPY